MSLSPTSLEGNDAIAWYVAHLNGAQTSDSVVKRDDLMIYS